MVVLLQNRIRHLSLLAAPKIIFLLFELPLSMNFIIANMIFYKLFCFIHVVFSIVVVRESHVRSSIVHP